MSTANPLGASLPRPRGRGRCTRRATHVLYLAYEPRQEQFLVHVSGLHEFDPDTNQRITTHPPSSHQLAGLKQAVAEICTSMTDHGLCAPVWKGNYVRLSEKHATDRDWLLLQIADRLQELRPMLTVKLRFADTDCINDCCR